MMHVHQPLTAAALAAVLLMGAGAPAVAGPDRAHGHGDERGQGTREPVRFMTYNASLNRETDGQMRADLATPDNAQAQAVAEVIQRTAPDVLLLNEFDHDPEGRSAELFHDNCLAVSQNIRTFQGFRRADMPGNLLPADSYTGEQAGQLRLSSESHWDVPVRIGTKTVHVLASHPTPPTFDGD